MATVIKSIPTLYGDDAKRFIKAATKAETKPATIKFSKQARIARAILEKAKMF